MEKLSSRQVGLFGCDPVEKLVCLEPEVRIVSLILEMARLEGADKIVFGCPAEDGLPRVPAAPEPEDDDGEPPVFAEELSALPPELAARADDGVRNARVHGEDLPVWFRAEKSWREVSRLPCQLLAPVIMAVESMYAFDLDADGRARARGLMVPSLHGDYLVDARLRMEPNYCYAVEILGPFTSRRG